MEPAQNFIKQIEEENKEKSKPKLYKESSFKKGESDPIQRLKREEMFDMSESSENDEEGKDVVMESEDKIGDLPMPKSMFAKPPPKFTGKAPSAKAPSGSSSKPAGKSYEPVPWEEVFDEREVIEDTIPVYYSGTNGPVIFCIHGAGHSALSFGPLAAACKEFARVVSFDIRGHGGHHLADETNMPVDILLQECMIVLKHVIDKYDDASIIICGHSLGGALAAKLTHSIIHPEEGKEPEFDHKHIVALFVIDVAEGSALGALPFMEQIVESRPSSFASLEEAIKWGVISGQVRNLNSARVTMPDLVHEKDGEWVWKTNLLASKDNWKEWFTGMNH